MKKAGRNEDDEMRAEYDFSAASRNPYAARYAKGSNIVKVRPDLFAAFPSEEAVNNALALLLDAGMRTTNGKPAPAKPKQSRAG